MKNYLSLIVIVALALLTSCSKMLSKEDVNEPVPACETAQVNCETECGSILNEIAEINNKFSARSCENLSDMDYYTGYYPMVKKSNGNATSDACKQIISADGEGAWDGVQNAWANPETWANVATDAVVAAAGSIISGVAAAAAGVNAIRAAAASLVVRTGMAMVCHGTEASLQAYKDNGNGSQNGNCGGYSVLIDSGNSGFWKNNVISYPTPDIVERDIAADTTTASVFNTFGQLHNLAVSEYLYSYDRNNALTISDSLLCITLGLDYEMYAKIPHDLSLSKFPQDATNKFNDILEMFFSLSRSEQVEYYEAIISSMEHHLNTKDSLLAWAIGGSTSILYYSSRFWIPFTPYNVADQYLLMNELDYSNITLVNASDLSNFLVSHSDFSYYIGIPIFNGNEIDRVYFFSSTPNQNRNGVSSIISNNIFRLPGNVTLLGHQYLFNEYPAVSNDEGDVCVFFSYQ